MIFSNKKWEYVKLEEVCCFQNGFAFKSKMFRDQGTPVLRISSIQNEELCDNRPVFVNRNDYKEDLAKYEVYNGDLVIAMSGATTGKVGFNNTGIIFLLNQRVGKFAPSEKLDIKFLFFYLLAEAEKNLKISAGSAQPNLSTKQIKSFLLPLPPLPEQKQTVAILDEAFAGINQAIANTEKNLANAHEVFESYLNGVFTRKGGGWADKKLSEILETGPRNGWSPPAKNHSDKGTPVVSLSSVTGFEFNLSKIKFTSAPVKPEAHYWLENGALLITRSNTPELVGHVAVCSGLNEPIIYPDLIMKMMLDKDVADTRFIYYQLRSKKLRELIMNSAQGANPTMKKINKSVVQNLPISLPSLQKQKTIVEKIDAIQKETRLLESIYQKKLTALAELKQSILHKAFTGELTQTPEQELFEVC
ncbi:MAG: hypothetical protein D3925_08255 [Candidatus Electrothrix sp. AR5]|nr:hypothetical protein [Candidatus Electrothrix sp. AR5]